jgi:hypothetical protein
MESKTKMSGKQMYNFTDAKEFEVVGGGGTYKGYFTSENSYVVDWESES